MKRFTLSILFFLTAATQTFSQLFNYPIIPDSIKNRQDRINYMTQHYWENADFSDSLLFIQPKIVLDYLYLLRSTPDKERVVCINNSLHTFASQPTAFEYLLFSLDRYLHDTQSPLYNDTMFIDIIDAMLEISTDERLKNELTYIKEVSSQNQIGSFANDFSFILKDGSIKALYDIESPLVLLVFNSPDCSICHKLEDNISKNDSIQQLITENQLKILAISPSADYAEWQNHKYPANWTCGFDNNMSIIKNHLYEIKQFPSIYLLDKDKRVLIKEVNYSTLVSTLFKQ